MGGRGTSSGASRQQPGRTATLGQAQQPQAPQQPAQAVQPVQQNVTLPPAPMQTTLQQLSQMNDQQVTNILKTAETVSLPNHLNDKNDPTQRLIFTIGLNTPPQVMDAKSFNAFMKANNIPQSQIMAREVGGGKFRTTSGAMRHLTSQQVAQMWTSDPYNYIGGKHGGQALGAGAYFDMNGGKGTGYARGGTKTVAILNPQTARVISMNQLNTKAAAWARTHPQADRQIRKMARSSQASFGNATASLYASVLGYNVISSPGGYHNVIDRGAVIVRQ